MVVNFQQSPFYLLAIRWPFDYQAPTSSMSSPTVHFEPSRLLHSSYDFSAHSPQVSMKLLSTVSDFMDLVRRKQASADQIEDFIAFVDDDRILPLCRPMVPEFRCHPSESDRAFTNHFVYACPNSENTDLKHVLQALTHRLPATPGGECPSTERERAFREKYKPEFDAMKAEGDETVEQLRGLATHNPLDIDAP